MAIPPEWISTLANSVATCLEPLEPLPPLGCHFHQCETGWEISVFPAHTEIVGGADDGRHTAPRFRVDLLGVADHFTEIHSITWQSKSIDDEDQLGCHLAIDGQHGGEAVSVRILRSAPACFDPGRKAMTIDGCLIEIW